MKHKHLIAFVAGSIAGVALAWQGHAQAWMDRLYPASMCEQSYGNGYLQDAQWNISGGSSAYSALTCPVIDERASDDAGLEHNEVTLVNLHGYDDGTKGWTCAFTCITEYAVYGGECSTYTCSSYTDTGNYTITLDSAAEMSAWRSPYNTYDFAYVRVELSNGWDATSGSQRFRGYFLTGG